MSMPSSPTNQICAFVVAPVTVKLKTASGCLAGPEQKVLAQVGHSENQLITGGPYLVEPNETGQAVVMVHNCSPTPIKLEQNELIGFLENVTNCDIQEINPAYIQEIAEIHSVERKAHNKQLQPLTEAKRKFMEDNIWCGPSVPDEVKKQYLDLVLKHCGIESSADAMLAENPIAGTAT